MGGIFDDIFTDDDFEIKDEEVLEDEKCDSADDWGTGSGATWDSGQKQDIWNADEPWSCDDGCDTEDTENCGGACDKNGDFSVDDYFS